MAGARIDGFTRAHARDDARRQARFHDFEMGYTDFDRTLRPLTRNDAYSGQLLPV